MQTRIDPISPGVYEVIGDLTFATVNQLLKLPEPLLSDQNSVKIILNKVHHIDSAGLALLIEWERQSLPRSPIKFSQANEQLVRLVNLYNLQAVLRIEN